MAKKSRKVVDVKKAAANDRETPDVKLPKKNASAVATGAAYHVLAGRPSKQAVISVFGKSGYALSWVARAEKAGNLYFHGIPASSLIAFVIKDVCPSETLPRDSAIPIAIGVQPFLIGA